jgi:fluoroacetyl-CoA thioesterase
MKQSLQVGLEAERVYTVDESMSPPHLPVKVLSTPAMLGLIEGTCLECAQPHLDEGETTVGTHVSISHVGPASAGEEVTVKVRLEGIEKRRQSFVVEVHSPRGVISSGSHERAVIDTGRWAGAADAG